MRRSVTAPSSEGQANNTKSATPMSMLMTRDDEVDDQACLARTK